MEPIERFKAMTSAVQDRAKKTLDNVLRKKDSEKVREENRKAELKACAEESQRILNDSSYPRQYKFLTELRAGYSKSLERQALVSTDPKIAGLGMKIENLDALLNRPKQAVKEYESMQKELNK
jgi:hypothetical protein